MGALLATKLHVPRRRRGVVPRPRLRARLESGEAALTLVSAPAGFGKTTLVTDWLAARGGVAAWLSLDQRDNDPVGFWTYVLSALGTAAPGVGAGALALLQSSSAPITEVLAALVNDLDATTDDLVLVLDDYHVIEAREVHEGMSFLLDHLPPHVHVVIATRADPALPLARLRARGELVEIRADDLRFTTHEAAEYLDDAMGLALTPQDVAALEARTEGWIAALQLAALSMQGREDVAGFVADFAGDDRYIVDYLVEEVLQRQPDDVRRFLLQTSVLGLLSGPLCDAVTGQDGGKAMLETLERDNLFLVPLDDRRRWYRYHHLFADVLQAHLLDEQPGAITDLHRRASAWFEQNDHRAEAIHHALAAQDHERAADLVEISIPSLTQARQETTLRRWMKALPIGLFAARPVLSAGYAGALMSTGDVVGVEARLRDAERWLGTTGAPPADVVVVDEDQWRRLPGQLAMYRAGQALIEGDVVASTAHARRALDLAAPDDHLGRGGPSAILGLGYWTAGDLESAYRWYADGMAALAEGGYDSDVVGGAVTLADILIVQGRLHEALSTYQRGRARAEATTPPLRGAADMHVGMSLLFAERDDLEAAELHLLRSRQLGEHSGLPKNPYRQRLAMARLRQLHGDVDGAFALLDEADRSYNSDFSPDVQPIPAVRARLCVACGRLDEALGWVRQRGLSPADDLDYVHEYEHVTLARVLLARWRAERTGPWLQQATALLERLLRAAEDGRRKGSVVEILVLQALAAQARGDLPAALGTLEKSLALAEPEGYVRTFVDEGPQMGALLEAVAKRGVARDYVGRLLAASTPGGAGSPVQQALVEPLSARELEVLRLLASDLDGPAIARELFVSLNTVRTHTKNIYAKLGVNSRRAAVRRAAELDLPAHAAPR